MPKNNIDYSNTIIYKIFCKNKLITDMYVGHTTNFINRKYHHKLACIKNKTNTKIYKIINENGGWDNWDMIEIASYKCKNSIEARIKEQQHFELLKPSLNSVSAVSMISSFPPKEEFICIKCNFKCSKESDFTRHNLTLKHNKNITNYQDESKFETNGNNMANNGNILETNGNINNRIFLCDCGKSYNSHSGLWKHKKSCQTVINNNKKLSKNNDENELHVLVDLVKQLVKENSELKNMMVEQQTAIIDKVLDSQNKFFEHSNNVTIELVKNGINNTTNNNTTTTTNTNSHNKAFNLNFFLNETCKNAMNINDFIDSIKLQLNDLISVGEIGYVESMSNIIVKKLNDLDETERPIHCTDKKRETIYIKDEDKWEKDDEDKKKLRKVINKISYKSQKLFPQFKEKYPDYNDSESNRSDQYSKIVIESMDDSNKDKQDKIIKNISKQVLIEK
jgi:hypothetical protein